MYEDYLTFKIYEPIIIVALIIITISILFVICFKLGDIKKQLQEIIDIEKNK